MRRAYFSRVFFLLLVSMAWLAVPLFCRAQPSQDTSTQGNANLIARQSESFETAVLTPRTHLNRQLSLSPKLILACRTACSLAAWTDSDASFAAHGAPQLALTPQVASPSLVSLHCLLAV